MRAGGRRIGGGLPIRPGQANRIHSFRRSKTMAWVHDVALTRSGRPVVVYATFGPVAGTCTGMRCGRGGAGLVT